MRYDFVIHCFSNIVCIGFNSRQSSILISKLFSLLLILMGVFSKYLIRINPLYSSSIGYIDRFSDITKINEKYMDIKPQTNMHISEGLPVYRHDRLFIKVYNTFWHTFGCDTHLFNINLLIKLSDVFCVTLQCTFCTKLQRVLVFRIP